MRIHRFDAQADVAEDIRDKYGFDGDLLQICAGNTGATVHKWHHHIPVCGRYLAPYRGQAVRFLEIGVRKGGSLQMWRRCPGEDAVIFGIDIDKECAACDGQAAQARIGPPADADFPGGVADETGGIDVRDSIAVIEKQPVHRPCHSWVG